MTSLRSIGISLAITVSVGCSAAGAPFEPSAAGGHEGTSGASEVAGATNAAGTGGSGSGTASGPSTSSGGAGGAGGTTGGTTSGGATNDAGMPCAVQALLQAKCSSCHGSKPVGGAPMSLVTYDDLAAPSKGNPSITYAALALTRMKSTSAPMPPGGPAATAAEIEAMSAWVSAGLPKGQCQPNTEPGPFDGGPVCTSNVYWTQGNHGSSKMHPGRACISCHTNGGGGGGDDDDGDFKVWNDGDDDDDAPQFAVAGTVFTTGHEPDDCNGGPQGTSQTALIEITDATGKVFKLTPNKVGNFYTTSKVAKPYKARVVFDGKERAMSASQSSGDCNSCHTQNGANGAPGRIVLP